MKKEIFCLAKSLKNRGYCVAGKDVKTGEWIRPITDSVVGGLSYNQCLTTGGSKEYQIYPGQLFSADLEKAETDKEFSYQTENWKFTDSHDGWRFINNYPVSARSLVDDPEDIWLEPEVQYTNRVSIKFANSMIYNSLMLIEFEELEIKKGHNDGLYGNFYYKGVYYELKITDPKQKDRGEEIIGPALITISLGVPYNGNVYKLIAWIGLID